MSKRKKISVNLSSRLIESLDKAAKFYGRTTSEIIREAVAEWLEKKGFLEGEND